MKAILLAAEGVQDQEYIYPYYRLQEEGFTLEVVVSGKLDCKCKYGVPIKATQASHYLAHFNYDLPDIVIVPGGWQAPEILRQDENILAFLLKMRQGHKIIGAICHGPSVLISAKVVYGIRMTCYKGMKDDLINAGGVYEDKPVVVHKNIITAPHYRNNPEFMREVLKACKATQMS